MKRQTKAINYERAEIYFVCDVSCFIVMFSLLVLVLESSAHDYFLLVLWIYLYLFFDHHGLTKVL